MRNYVAKNAVAAGAKAQTHTDRKRAQKKGYEKHKLAKKWLTNY